MIQIKLICKKSVDDLENAINIFLKEIDEDNSEVTGFDFDFSGAHLICVIQFEY
jgi:hypothetical protein